MLDTLHDVTGGRISASSGWLSALFVPNARLVGAACTDFVKAVTVVMTMATSVAMMPNRRLFAKRTNDRHIFRMQDTTL